jgi:hypothetical protein
MRSMQGMSEGKCPNHNRYNYKLLRWFLAELGVFGVLQQFF